MNNLNKYYIFQVSNNGAWKFETMLLSGLPKTDVLGLWLLEMSDKFSLFEDDVLKQDRWIDRHGCVVYTRGDDSVLLDETSIAILSEHEMPKFKMAGKVAFEHGVYYTHDLQSEADEVWCRSQSKWSADRSFRRRY